MGIVCIELLLQLENNLVSFVETSSEGNHYVSLFEKQVFVAIHLSLVLLDGLTLTFQLIQLVTVDSMNALVFLLQQLTEHWCFLNLFTTNQELTLHERNLFFKLSLCLFLLDKFSTPFLEGCNSCHLVLLSSSGVLLQLLYMLAVDGTTLGTVLVALFRKLCTQSLQLLFILSEECSMVEVLIHLSVILNILGPIGKTQCRQCLVHDFETGRYCGDEMRLAITSERISEKTSQFRVPVRNMFLRRSTLFWICECTNHLPQCRK
mmetsp:Transcript_4805/g.17980  ORF Transcript_4805/g.17980 Transcript_4805/m.17980 type:complete len:263 (+) Transcript_4805:1829-2617(+)